MKIITWNCRGIANGRARMHVKQLVNSTKADVLCLLEIRSPKANKMIKLSNSLGFTNHFIVEPLGFAGGLLLLWKQGQVNLNIISHSSQAIHTKICLGVTDCFFTFSYVRPNPIAKSRFWDDCKTFGNLVNAPWIVLGDFNDIAAMSDQWGSMGVNNHNIQKFVDAFNSCGLIDPGASGPSFTWCRWAGNRIIQRRRFDRVFWNTIA